MRKERSLASPRAKMLGRYDSASTDSATRARVAYLNALYDYRVARVRLAAAAGPLAGVCHSLTSLA